LFVAEKVSYFGDRGKLLRTAIVDISKQLRYLDFDGLVDVIELVADSSGLMLF
jgi:hypothetical protein